MKCSIEFWSESEKLFTQVSSFRPMVGDFVWKDGSVYKITLVNWIFKSFVKNEELELF